MQSGHHVNMYEHWDLRCTFKNDLKCDLKKIWNVKCYNLYTSTWHQSSRSIATGKSFVTVHQFKKLIQIQNWILLVSDWAKCNAMRESVKQERAPFQIHGIIEVGLLQFTHYCVEKILAKISDRGEKMTNIKYVHGGKMYIEVAFRPSRHLGVFTADFFYFQKFPFDSWSLPSSTCYQIHLLPFNIGEYWEPSENILSTVPITSYHV